MPNPVTAKMNQKYIEGIIRIIFDLNKSWQLLCCKPDLIIGSTLVAYPELKQRKKQN